MELTEEDYRRGEQYRIEWYQSRNIEMVLSWNALPTVQKTVWVEEANEFDNNPILQEAVI